jgi:hypothetical protein
VEGWREITADEYSALPGREGRGLMGAVFKYDASGAIIARRTFDEYNPDAGWAYAVPTTDEVNANAR